MRVVGGARLVIYSDRELIAEGLVGLLPDEWQSAAWVVATEDALDDAPVAAVIVDARSPGAAAAALRLGTSGVSVVVLLGAIGDQVDPALLSRADAVVLRDEIEPLTLRVALAAGRLGMRLLPRGLGSPGSRGEAVGLGEPGQRVLGMLAEGLRDAEIAHELNLSESAVRKLVQRTVRRVGARTRAQAVAAAIRDGDLDRG